MRKEKAPAKKRGTGPLLEMSVATMSGLSFPELGKLLAGWQQESKKCDDPYVERYEQVCGLIGWLLQVCSLLPSGSVSTSLFCS